MGKKKIVVFLLICSTIMNVIFFGAAGAFINKKGGVTYVTSKFKKTTNQESFYPMYNSKISFYEMYPKKENQIVFLGDSIIAHFDWNELYGTQNIQNRGIPGDTTAGVLNRLKQITSTYPKKIFILIGINDLQANRPVSTIVSNYEKIIDGIKTDTPETKIIATSLMPVNNEKYVANFQINANRVNKEVEELNGLLKPLVESKGGVFVDIYKVMSSNGQLISSYTYDGLHINAEGYKLWKNEIDQLVLN